MKKKSYTWLIVAAAALVIVIFLISRKKALPVEICKIKQENVFETVTASGKVAGSRIVPVSFQKQGRITHLFHREGSVVSSKDTIMILDNKEESVTVKQQRENLSLARIHLQKLLQEEIPHAQELLNQAEAQESLLQKQFNRQSELLKQNAISESDADNAKANLALATSDVSIAKNKLNSLKHIQTKLLETQIKQAENALESALIALSKTILLAPDSGMIVNRTVDVGQTVSAGIPVISFLPLDTSTNFEILVDENDIAKIKLNQNAIVSISPDAESKYETFVHTIFPIVDASRGTATVQLLANRVIRDFLPDQTIFAQIIIDSTTNAIVLEQRYIKKEQNEYIVYLIKNNRAQKKIITCKDIGNSRFLVTSGLQINDEVISGTGLKNGISVAIVK
jgi:HlyD family secretion protein